MDANWFKVWPAQWLNILNRIPNVSVRSDVLMLAFHCLNEGGLPDNDDDISWISGLPAERVTELRPYLARLATVQDGRLMLSFVAEVIEERQQFAERRSRAARARYKQDGNAEQSSALPHGAESTSAMQSNAMQCSPMQSNALPNKQTDKQTDRQTSMQAEEGRARVREEGPPPPSDEDCFTSLPADEPAIEAELDVLKAAVYEVCGLQPTGWRLDGEAKSRAIELHAIGTTPGELRAACLARGSPFKLDFVVKDFQHERAKRRMQGARAAQTQTAAEDEVARIKAEHEEWFREQQSRKQAR